MGVTTAGCKELLRSGRKDKACCPDGAGFYDKWKD